MAEVVDEAAAKAQAATLDAAIFKHSGANKRSIPEAIFVENVEALCKGITAQDVVTRLQELYGKYQYMQSSLTAQRAGLKTKLPDIQSAMETVNHLADKKAKATEDGTTEATEYTYQLSENIYAKAAVPPTDCVCLWLGANCMLEYSLEEATDLLKNNENTATVTLASVEEDMVFLRDQITTTEVNIARCHNYGVKERQKLKDANPAVADAPAGAAPAPGQKFNPPSRKSGSGDGYTWKDEGEEIEVSVSVGASASKSDIKVAILPESLKVEHQGKVLIEGDLAGSCRPGGSTWTCSAGKVEITLEKAHKETSWSSLFTTTEV